MLFGIFCKGLHCAGCKSGSWLLILPLIVLMWIASRSREIPHIIHDFLIWTSIGVAAGGVGATVSVIYLLRHPQMANVAKWDGITFTEQKNMELWGQPLSDADYRAMELPGYDQL